MKSYNNNASQSEHLSQMFYFMFYLLQCLLLFPEHHIKKEILTFSDLASLLTLCKQASFLQHIFPKWELSPAPLYPRMWSGFYTRCPPWRNPPCLRPALGVHLWAPEAWFAPPPGISYITIKPLTKFKSQYFPKYLTIYYLLTNQQKCIDTNVDSATEQLTRVSFPH